MENKVVVVVVGRVKNSAVSVISFVAYLVERIDEDCIDLTVTIVLM